MRPEDFESSSAGRLVKGLDGLDAFLPNTPPEQIELTPGLFDAVTRAERYLGRLDGVARTMPDPSLMVRAFVRREAQLSSRIENTFARFNEIGLFDDDPAIEKESPDVREVWNNERAIRHGVQAIREHGRDFSVSLVREMHRLLLEDVRGADKQPGRFRERQVWIGKSGDVSEATFVPPPATFVPELMDQLASFVATPARTSAMHPLVRVAVAHYQFETIHPFLDGNGRVGRAIILLQMLGAGVLTEPCLVPSLALERRRGEYYAGLLAVSQRGEWSRWAEFFTQCLAESAEDSLDRLNRLRTLRETWKRLAEDRTRSVRLHRLIDHLFVSPGVTIPGIAELLKITYRPAKGYVEELVKLGIVHESGESSRGKLFIAEAIAKVMESPTA